MQERSLEGKGVLAPPAGNIPPLLPLMTCARAQAEAMEMLGLPTH